MWMLIWGLWKRCGPRSWLCQVSCSSHMSQFSLPQTNTVLMSWWGERCLRWVTSSTLRLLRMEDRFSVSLGWLCAWQEDLDMVLSAFVFLLVWMNLLQHLPLNQARREPQNSAGITSENVFYPYTIVPYCFWFQYLGAMSYYFCPEDLFLPNK